MFRILRRNRKYVLLGAGIYGIGFFIGSGLGFATGTIDPTTVPINNSATQLQVSDVSLMDILGRNAVNVAIMSLGAVLFGTITIVLGLKNGFVHGVIVGISIVESGKLGLVALFFLPHAVIELPAIWIAIAAGVKIPAGFIGYLREERSTPIERSEVVDSTALFLLAEGLVVISAVIEYYVTLHFVRLAA